MATTHFPLAVGLSERDRVTRDFFRRWVYKLDGRWQYDSRICIVQLQSEATLPATTEESNR